MLGSLVCTQPDEADCSSVHLPTASHWHLSRGLCSSVIGAGWDDMPSSQPLVCPETCRVTRVTAGRLGSDLWKIGFQPFYFTMPGCMLRSCRLEDDCALLTVHVTQNHVLQDVFTAAFDSRVSQEPKPWHVASSGRVQHKWSIIVN